MWLCQLSLLWAHSIQSPVFFMYWGNGLRQRPSTWALNSDKIWILFKFRESQDGRKSRTLQQSKANTLLAPFMCKQTNKKEQATTTKKIRWWNVFILSPYRTLSPETICSVQISVVFPLCNELLSLKCKMCSDNCIWLCVISLSVIFKVNLKMYFYVFLLYFNFPNVDCQTCLKTLSWKS